MYIIIDTGKVQHQEQYMSSHFSCFASIFVYFGFLNALQGFIFTLRLQVKINTYVPLCESVVAIRSTRNTTETHNHRPVLVNASKDLFICSVDPEHDDGASSASHFFLVQTRKVEEVYICLCQQLGEGK